MLGEVKGIEYRDLFESTDEVKHNMDMVDSKGKKTGDLIFKTHFTPNYADVTNERSDIADPSFRLKKSSRVESLRKSFRSKYNDDQVESPGLLPAAG